MGRVLPPKTKSELRAYFLLPEMPATLPLFSTGWKEGVAQAEQVYAQMDLELIEDIGHAAGFTSKRPPRNYRWVYAERDGVDAKLHGEALKRFISGWRQTGGDRRRIKGV